MADMIQGLALFGSTLSLVYVVRQVTSKMRRKNRTT